MNKVYIIFSPDKFEDYSVVHGIIVDHSRLPLVETYIIECILMGP